MRIIYSQSFLFHPSIKSPKNRNKDGPQVSQQGRHEAFLTSNSISFMMVKSICYDALQLANDPFLNSKNLCLISNAERLVVSKLSVIPLIHSASLGSPINKYSYSRLFRVTEGIPISKRTDLNFSMSVIIIRIIYSSGRNQ
jgi:hypothetical protein